MLIFLSSVVMTEECLRNKWQESVFLKKSFNEERYSFDENATVPSFNTDLLF